VSTVGAVIAQRKRSTSTDVKSSGKLCCLFAQWQERGTLRVSGRDGARPPWPTCPVVLVAGSAVVWSRSPTPATLPVERRISRNVGASIDRSQTIDQRKGDCVCVARGMSGLGVRRAWC